MLYAASDSAFLVSDSFFNSACFIISSFLLIAISVSDLTSASFASRFASASAIATSLSASAFAIEASFCIWDILSCPRAVIRPLSSSILWILHEIILIPSALISSCALDWTSSPNFFLLVHSSFNSTVPIISLILP